MKAGIVYKLFLLTTGLCLLVLASILLGQTIFFKQAYVHHKVETVKDALRSVREDEAVRAGNPEALLRLERTFYEQTSAWLAVLDEKGFLKGTDDFRMGVRLERTDAFPALSGASITIPLYTVMDVEQASPDHPLFPVTLTQAGQRIAMEGVMLREQWYPQRIGRSASNLREENRLENRQLIQKEFEVVPRFANPTEYHNRYPSVLVHGTVTDVRMPQGAQASRYANRLLLDRVKAFQADLLYGDDAEQASSIIDYVEHEIPYKIFVERITYQAGKPVYLFAMTSLQPVNEATGVMRNYYGYIAVGTLLLVLLVSFYASRTIAAPLLRIDAMTQQMAKLDFTERIPIRSADEIGNLSRNINQLSEMLQAHIARLEQDVEREKRLEETRKQFIAGVSHELKTPLSVMESCLYILKDKADSSRREYYFAAMEDEVKHMSLLIQDMLELARYESGTYRMEVASFRIDALLERVCEKLVPELAGKKLRLRTLLAPTQVVANRHRIEQVVVNFLTNAIRYTPEQNEIVVEAEEGTDTVIVSIENKGVHIPAEQLEQIWDRFYRGESSRHRSTGGTGLGLAISRQILELHGATYGAKNTEEGVLFYFELKKATQEAEPDETL